MKEFYAIFKTVQDGESISRAEAKNSVNWGNALKRDCHFAKIGKYGAMLQRGETESEQKPDFAPILKSQSMETITLEEALLNFSLPRSLGNAEDGEEVVVSVGRFGPYIRHGKTFVSIREDELLRSSVTKPWNVFVKKHRRNKTALLKTFPKEGIQIVNGRFGPLLLMEKECENFCRYRSEKLSVTDCKALLEKAPVRKFRKNKPSCERVYSCCSWGFFLIWSVGSAI